MERQYQALPINELGSGAGIRRPTQAAPATITLDSPAVEAMTDLARTAPATIRPQAPVEAANRFMIARGVRLLLVVDDGEVVLGVLTATDILGEKAVRVAIERGLKRDELTVADIMTGAGDVEVLAIADVQAARVGHVVETLRRAGRQHALVAEQEPVPPRQSFDPPAKRTFVRGIFSISQVARQLGIAAPVGGEVARTFSEIESAIAR
jgi:CBS domain-containing protein